MTSQISRASRLIELDRLIRGRPRGLTVKELADKVGCSARTIQRDIQALQDEPLYVPLEVEGRRWKTMSGAPSLAPIRFTLQEARAIFLATRLFLRYADEQDPDGISALDKVADALPQTIGSQVKWTADQLRSRPQKGAQTDALRKLTEAWAQSQTVTVRYRSAASPEAHTFDLDPYFLEPSTSGAATYILGFSHRHQAVRSFKLDRFEDVALTGRPFVAADVREAVERMSHSWGGVVVGEGDDEYHVVIEFSAGVASRVAETRWHQSQELTHLPGGGVRLALRLPSLLEFIPWVRSWGPDARVMAPEELLEPVARSMREAAALYAS